MLVVLYYIYNIYIVITAVFCYLIYILQYIIYRYIKEWNIFYFLVENFKITYILQYIYFIIQNNLNTK